ncbi:MAG: hypothetical protein EPO28_15430 [Saprospiraceae bacterium]|nr:MAG: hypothetical protein EPO28_15430 [Saprospiraceae bacterium]
MESHNDKLEEFFRRTLDGQNGQPSGNGWDMPSGKVWQGIETGMNTNGRRKPGFVKYGLMALVLLLVSTIAYQWWTFDEKVENLTEQVHQHVATIEQLEKDLNEKETNRPEKAASDGIVKEDSGGKLPTGATTTGGMIAGKSLANQKREAASPAFTFKAAGANAYLPNRNPEATTSAAGGNQRGAVSPGTADASAQNTAISANSSEKRLGAAQMETGVADAKMAETSTAQLLLKWPELKTDSPLSIFIKNSGTPSILLTSATNPPSPQKLHTTLNAYFSPAYSWRSIRHKMTDESTPYEKTESPELSYTAGVLAGVNVSSRWHLYSGISYQRFSQTSEHTIGLRYTTSQAITDPNGNIVSTYQTNLQTSFGDAEVELRVANNSSSNEPDINEGHIFPVRFTAEERLEHLGIPVLLEYRVGGKQLALSLKGGVVGSFLVGKEMRITGVRAMHPRLISREVDIPATKFLRNINDFTLDTQLSAGVHAGLSKRLSLVLEPTFRINITPIFENARLETRMFSLALNTGISVRL